MAESSSSEVTLALLRSDILKLQDDVSRRFDDVERKLDRVNGSVRQHETRIALLENFCKEQVKPALAQVVENRVQIATVLAKYAAGGLGLGAGLGTLIAIIAKAAGWI